MNSQIYDRLNRVKDRLASAELLNNSRLGNEIGFYIFDYPPRYELEVRRHIETVINQIDRRIAKIDLFEFLIRFLEGRKLLDPAIKIQKLKGNVEMFHALKGSIDEEKWIAPEIMKEVNAASPEIVIMTGVGSAYPLLRTHRLLSCLQPLMKNIPLVVFYPGEYTGQTLSLFGLLKDDNYYRAFRLVP